MDRLPADKGVVGAREGGLRTTDARARQRNCGSEWASNWYVVWWRSVGALRTCNLRAVAAYPGGTVVGGGEEEREWRGRRGLLPWSYVCHLEGPNPQPGLLASLPYSRHALPLQPFSCNPPLAPPFTHPLAAAKAGWVARERVWAGSGVAGGEARERE